MNFWDFARNEMFIRSFAKLALCLGDVGCLGHNLRVAARLFTTRFEFRGAAIIQTLGVIPLIMPPFAGAIAMQLFFGRNGSVNLLLGDWFGINIPFMEG